MLVSHLSYLKHGDWHPKLASARYAETPAVVVVEPRIVVEQRRTTSSIGAIDQGRHNRC